MEDLFGEDSSSMPRAPYEPNPCVRWLGKGPEGKKCRTCAHIVCRAFSKRYYKCDIRPITGGPATDHRLKWNACAKYEERD